MEDLRTRLRGPASILLDERGRPDFRDAFGFLSSEATVIKSAVTRVHLTTLDLTEAELAKVRSFRVLLAEVNALRLDTEARTLQADPHRAARVRRLSAMLESGRMEVRAAPLAGWSPDFTAFATEGGPVAVITGHHLFARPYAHRGPAMASIHFGEGARLAFGRHDELWGRAHDVGPALWGILTRAPRAARFARAVAR